VICALVPSVWTARRRSEAAAQRRWQIQPEWDHIFLIALAFLAPVLRLQTSERNRAHTFAINPER